MTRLAPSSCPPLIRSPWCLPILLAAGLLGAAAVAAGAPPAGDDTTYLKYVQPTVGGPFPDGIRLVVPPALARQPQAAWGLVDVTQPPFGADPSGRRDSTAALQQAIDLARDHQLVCFFPSGTYRVSDTLSCVQQLYRRSNGRVLGSHLWPCVLVGSRAAPARPKIVLAPRSPGFADPRQPKFLLHFWARGYANPTTAGRVGDGLGPEQEQPNISMNQMLVNIDLQIGEGNPGAIAVRHQAAEGSAIEDCTIDATHALAGVQGGIGSGGGSANVTVVGGQIGLDYTGFLSGTQPTPTITGFTLRGQTRCAIRSSSRQTLVAAGLVIEAGPGAATLIDCTPGASRANHGQLSLIDSRLSFPSGGAAPARRTAIATGSSVYLRNVYLQGATELLADAAVPALPRDPRTWVRLAEAAFPGPDRQQSGVRYRYRAYRDGVALDGPLVGPLDPAAPPADLQARHLWNADFPTAHSPAAANVKLPPYNAAGDGVADDTAALQRAIDHSRIVFLPKGYYRLTRTLQLKPHTRLVGVAQHLSVLVARAEGAFADAAQPAPLVRTADDPRADTVLAFCGLFAANDVPGCQALHWQSGGASVLRAVEICEQPINGFVPRKKSDPQPPLRQAPLVLVTGHGGGNWYNFRAGSAWRHGRHYRHLLVEDAAGPLRIYQCSPQHVESDAAVELRRSRHVSFFGTKYEGNAPMLRISGCDHIQLLGHGGNGKPLEEGALILIERTPNFLLANLVEGPTRIVPGPHTLGQGDTTDPRTWSMLEDRPAAGPPIRLPPLDRPVLYRRGAPADQ